MVTSNGANGSWYERRKAAKSSKRAQRARPQLAHRTGAPLRVDTGDGKWILNLSEWESEFERATVQLEAGRFAEARAAMERLARTAPEGTPFEARALWGLGCTFADDDVHQALVLFERATQIDDGMPEYWHNLGMAAAQCAFPMLALCAWRRYVEAGAEEAVVANLEPLIASIEAAIRRQIDETPGLSEARMIEHEDVFRFGFDALRRRDYQVALRAFQRSAAINPSHVGNWNNLGFAFLELGDRESAVAAWRRALELAPDNKIALNNLAATLGPQLGDR